MAFKQVVEESGDEKKRNELGGRQWSFRREGEKLTGAAKGKIEEEGEYLYQESDLSHRWIKGNESDALHVL